jgi:uncharacterized protein (UPF0333 family)
MINNIKNKSQVSLEFIMIFGIAFTVILMVVGLFFEFSSSSKKTLDKQYLDKIGTQIKNEIDNIYYLGVGNRISLKVNIPSGIKNIIFLHKKSLKIPIFDYDVLQIQYTGNRNQTYLNYLSNNPENIRFKCSINCETTNNITNNISYYTEIENLNQGPKVIRIENKGNYISVDFVRDLG